MLQGNSEWKEMVFDGGRKVTVRAFGYKENRIYVQVTEFCLEKKGVEEMD